MDYPTSDTEARLSSGKFTDGDVSASPVVPPSKNSAAYQNMVFDELLNVITAGGLTPSDQSVNQLITAINNVIASAIANKSNNGHGHSISDVSGLQTALDGKSSTGHSHTSGDLTDFGAAVGGLFAQSLTETGYSQMPGGLVVQWGRSSVAGQASITVTFPMAFPGACFVAIPVAGGTSAGGGVSDYFGVSSITATSFLVTSRYDGAQDIIWMALGV
jgi:hypothetical protein